MREGMAASAATAASKQRCSAANSDEVECVALTRIYRDAETLRCGGCCAGADVAPVCAMKAEHCHHGPIEGSISAKARDGPRRSKRDAPRSAVTSGMRRDARPLPDGKDAAIEAVFV